jgi:DNA-directed RNA polymerase subunit L
MELVQIESNNNSMLLEVKGERHSFMNLVRKELWNVSGVEDAGYAIKHPQVSDPCLVIRTKKVKPKKALQQAVSSIKSQISELKALTKKI